MNSDFTSYWQRKISALVHDTPDKATDIINHELRAERFQRLFGLSSSRFDKRADISAASADRLPFPDPRKSGLIQPLADIQTLAHPMGGASLANASFKSSAEAEEISQKSMPHLMANDDPRAAFICAWRFWRNWASSADSRFSHLPADTRIPDHTIWNHLAVTTAFQGSLPHTQEMTPENAPRLLLFSLGPVQPLIAAARSTRDLWSGSYLLSYLISQALGRIALDLGPDHVLFPNLLDQPLIDLALKEDIYGKHRFSKDGKDGSLWEGFSYDEDANLSKLLTPSLPNRFMALLPASLPDNGISAEEYAAQLVEDIKDVLSGIADTIITFVEENGLQSSFDPKRFSHQIDSALEFHWQTLPIPNSAEDLDLLLEKLPADQESTGYSPRKAFEAIRKMVSHPDCKPQYEPIRTEGNWAGLNALLSWLHDGAKANRSFDAWSAGEWKSGMDQMKDSLTGKEEAVLTISSHQNDDELKSLCKKLKVPQNTFKSGETLGALSLIKRLWWHTWLGKEKILGLTANQLRARHPMPNTHALALGQPFADSDEDEDLADRDKQEKYFAILALDGDEMGKWISGSNSPEMVHCLSPNAEKFYREKAPNFLDAPRAVTPSWHQQFSEALGNFSFYCVQRIVEAYDGRLIYAGGDDVLAMLSAKDALPCARALRAAFRGEVATLNEIKGTLTGSKKSKHSDRRTPLFDLKEEGYLRLHEKSGAAHGDQAALLSDPVHYPALLPGPKTDVSVGIAIAHFKAPLQDVVRAAQAAEKRAKNFHGRAAVAVSLFKRSGEILEWGSKWSSDESKTQDSAGIQLLSALIKALGEQTLNSRFPHKLEALLTPYLPQSSSIQSNSEFENRFSELITAEVAHTLKRNEGGRLEPNTVTLFSDYWRELTKTVPDFEKQLTLFINLLRTAAWSATKEKLSEADTTYSLPETQTAERL